ncbi:hypothetical protein BaOVIS_021270 [Babesia ovis]|uniref:Uncharacterized protein n=1 Tax=Babesia ovis TaxID=5869 RepID=A0A9W5TDG3_BABOV|nr:hypothetical protein BaOVIS_021270 [Babesia ovis]
MSLESSDPGYELLPAANMPSAAGGRLWEKPNIWDTFLKTSDGRFQKGLDILEHIEHGVLDRKEDRPKGDKTEGNSQ